MLTQNFLIRNFLHAIAVVRLAWYYIPRVEDINDSERSRFLEDLVSYSDSSKGPSKVLLLFQI